MGGGQSGCDVTTTDRIRKGAAGYTLLQAPRHDQILALFHWAIIWKSRNSV